MTGQSNTYTIHLARSAAKELGKVPEPVRGRIVRALRSLEHDPYIGKALKGELKGLFSLRVWPYRIIYSVMNSQLIVEVIDVGHRQGVYKHRS